MRSVQTWNFAPELCTDLIVLKESYVLSFVGKTTRLIFVEICLRVTRTHLCTAFAESKYFFVQIWSYVRTSLTSRVILSGAQAKSKPVGRIRSIRISRAESV